MKSSIPKAPTSQVIERHRVAQRLAYECAETVGRGLEVGVTEREAARRVRAWLEAKGVADWLHLPFAWFGDRTAFHRFRQPLQFFPTDRRLEAGMPFILDCAPVYEGAQVDIGYSGALGEHVVVAQIQRALLEHRALILDGVRANAKLADVYRAVDALARRQGLENRHQKYPFRVLGHRLVSPEDGLLPRLYGFGFGVRSLRSLFGSVAFGLPGGWSPFWADSRFSEHRPVPGLWAVEPHLALGPVGAKFEEILVVTEDAKDSFWLDESVPHVRLAEPERNAA